MEDLGSIREDKTTPIETGANLSLFAATHWSVVATASQQDSTKAAAALEQLCQAYWFPLYAYVRRRGYSAAEAQDLTQEFFAQFLRRGTLSRANPRRGKFRCFLLACMAHFLANERRRSQAAKRCPESIVPLDATAESRYGQDLAVELTPEKLYERRWALSLFDRALVRLNEQHQSPGKAALYQALKGFLSSEPRDGEYARVAAQLGMSHGAVSTAVCRLREHYRDLVREEIAHTVSSREELEEELRWLIVAVG